MTVCSKSHTMMGGGGESMGIIPLLNKNLFDAVLTMSTAATKFLVTVSYLEIYNEVIHDLLNPVKDKTMRVSASVHMAQALHVLKHMQ
jgi:centromeric protein E